MEKRNYQIEVLRKLNEVRAHGLKRAIVVMASGLGKTAVSAFDVDAFMHSRGGKVLFLCDNNSVLSQNLEAYRSILGNKYSYGFFNSVEKKPDAQIVFASFQTMRNHMDDFSRGEFAYIVVDEAHHAPADSYNAVIDYFQAEFLLGLTATPYRLDGAKLSYIFGEPIYELELAEAISRNLLVDVEYHLMLNELSDLDDISEADNMSVTDFNKCFFAPKSDEKIAEIIMARKEDGHNMLVYCRSIDHANAMRRLLPGSMVVHSGLSRCKNNKALWLFRKKKIQILISVDMLNEGIDVPHADMIVFLRSTVSPVVFQQQLGRGLRLCEGKSKVVVLDFVGNVERLYAIKSLVNGIEQHRDSSSTAGLILKIESSEKDIQLDELLEIIDEKTKNGKDCANDPRLLAQVWRLAKDLGRAPTEREFDLDVWTDSSARCVELYGSWNQFLVQAGFDVSQRIITDTEIRLWEAEKRLDYLRTGKTPDVTIEYLMDEFSYDNIDRVLDYYRTLDRIAYRIVGGENYDFESWIRKQCDGRSDEMPSETMARGVFGASVIRAISKRYGSWEKCLRKATIALGSSEEMYLSSILLAVKKMGGRVPTIDEYDLLRNEYGESMAESSVIVDYFGSWKEFLDWGKISIYTDSEIIADVRRAVEIDDRVLTQPKYFDMITTTLPSAEVKKRLNYASWHAVLWRAGYRIEHDRFFSVAVKYEDGEGYLDCRTTDDDVLDLVRELARSRDIDSASLKKYFSMRYGNKFCRIMMVRFGTWANIIEYALAN